jgi:hypothetical protein
LKNFHNRFESEQLLALREEVDRLGQPPSGYGVLLGAHDDDTVDVFTSGRKMRLTCSPNIPVKDMKKGQTVRLNEALTVVEAGSFEAVGEISTLREVLADGVVSEEERLQLKQMQAKFGMTDEQVEAIAEQVRREKEASTVQL